MKRLALALLFSALVSAAHAQSTVSVIGPITPGDCTEFASITVLKDAGIICSASVGGVTSVTNSDGTLTISPTTGAVVISIAALTSGKFLVGNGSNIATGVAMSGDATLANTGAVTLATVNSGSGSVGSSTAIPVLTTNAKGLVTVQTTAAVVAPAGTLTGSTLASGVTASSLTSVGTLASLTVSGNTTTNVTGSTQCVQANTAGVLSGTGAVCPTSSGTMVLLNTLTASNSASLSDTTSLTSTYSSYEIVWENIIPATLNAAFEAQVQVGGTFQTSGYLAAGTSYDTAAAAQPFTSTTYFPLSVTGALGIYNAAPGGSGHMRIYNPSASTIIQMTAEFTHAYSSSEAFWGSDGGYYNSSGAVTGLKFVFASGNITSGVVKIYGIL